MKLVTDLSPRANGTVVAEFGKTKYVFKPGEDGRLSAEVANEGDALALLDTGNFYPASLDDSGPAVEIADLEKAVDAAEAALGEATAAHEAAPTTETEAALGEVKEAAKKAKTDLKAALKAAKKK